MIILTKWIFEKSKTNTTKINKFFFFSKKSKTDGPLKQNLIYLYG